ncbi:MAG: hypothetical protein AAF525_10255 [Pseudomonadota bacterium]
MPGRNKGREYVVKRPGEIDRDEAHDPLMLPSESDSENESDGMDADGGPEGEGEPSEQAGGPTQGSPDGDATAAEEAQEAVAEAAEVLKRAGEVLKGAETDEEIAQAAEILSDARVAVIVAGQVLNDAAAENPQDGDEYDEIQRVLSEANVAIVLAGQTIYGMPDYESVEDAFPGGEGAEDDLDQELEESLEVFDRQIADARTTVLGDGGGGAKDGQGIPTGGIILAGADLPELPPSNGDEPGTVGAKPGEGAVEDAAPNEPQTGDTPLIPEDIGDGQDDDIVAQQLREAAIAEKDPDLREKLWEEYRRYKSSF